MACSDCGKDTCEHIEAAEKEKAEKEKAEREKAEKEKAEREKAEREQAEREQAEREQAEREQAEREKTAAEEAQKKEALRKAKEKDKEKPRDIVGDALDELRRAEKKRQDGEGKRQDGEDKSSLKHKIYVDNSRTEYHYNSGGKQFSFADRLDVLPERWDDPGESEFDADELREQSEALRVGRLVIVSCDDMSRARGAAKALANAIGIPLSRRRLLDLQRHPAFVIEECERIDPNETVVVIDAFGDSGEKFINSLFSEKRVHSYANVGRDFDTHGLSLICLVEPQRLGQRVAAAKRPPACWEVSFVRQLLRRHYPKRYAELDETIAKQRERGRWAGDEETFRKQLKQYIDDETLLEVINRGGPVPEANNELAFPPDDQLLQIAVLYTAAFYPGLAPNEFSRVLCTLLGEQKMLVPEPVEYYQLKHEKRLDEIWKKDGNVILRKCGLITSREAPRGIVFEKAGRRDAVRSHLEDHYGLYVQQQFLTAWEKHLLFDESEGVADAVIGNTIEMAGSYPQQFDSNWLLGVVLSPVGIDDLAKYLFAFSRVIKLLNRIFDQPAVAEKVVLPVIRGLIDRKEHALAFDIIGRLRNDAGFDELSWLKELVDGSPESIHGHVGSYLRNELRRYGTNVYWVLRRLESWRPEKNRELGRYTFANKLVLGVIMKYALEITAEFETGKYGKYGKWPSRFPLLATDADNAKEDFATLVRWLFDPGMPMAIPSDVTRVVAALLSEWVFILFGSPEAASHETQIVTAGPATLSADRALSLLLEQILAATKSREQEAMLSYWEAMRNALVLAPAQGVKLDRATLHELAWKRNLMRRLITDFRHLQRERRPSRASAASVTA
jgi:hypothetical protein